MKTHRILCLAAVLVLPQLGMAKLPPSSALAQVEGTLDFCAKNDPQSAGKYEERKKLLVQGEPEKDVAEARQTPENNEFSARQVRARSQGHGPLVTLTI